MYIAKVVRWTEHYCDGVDFDMLDFDGYRMGELSFANKSILDDIEGHFKTLKQTKIRGDDVFVMTYPKSGECLFYLYSDG